MTYHDLNQSEHSLDGRRPMRVEQSVTRSTTASNLTLSLSGSTTRGLDWDVWLSGRSRQFLRGERCLCTTDMTRTRPLSGTLNYSNKSNILTIFMVWSMCIEQTVQIQYIIILYWNNFHRSFLLISREVVFIIFCFYNFLCYRKWRKRVLVTNLMRRTAD